MRLLISWLGRTGFSEPEAVPSRKSRKVRLLSITYVNKANDSAKEELTRYSRGFQEPQFVQRSNTRAGQPGREPFHLFASVSHLGL